MHSSSWSALSFRSTFLLALGAGALGANASAQQLLHSYDKPYSASENSYLESIVNVGDVDGDGSDDLVLGNPSYSLPLAQCGRLQVLSAATGTILFDVIGSYANGRLGVGIAAAGDWNGDSRPDVLASQIAAGIPSVGVYSGATGLVVQTFLAPPGVTAFGERLASGFDADFDGYPDIVITGVSAGKYVAFTYSGATNGLIWSLSDLGNEWFEGTYLRVTPQPIADVDADGVKDIALSTPGWFVPGAETGRLRIHSGTTGSVIREIFPPASVGAQWFGHTCVNVGDLDADGFDELAVAFHIKASSSFSHAGTGVVDIISSASGARLFTLASKDIASLPAGTHCDLFGHAISGVPDVDGDGVREILIGAAHANVNTNGGGGSYLFSGRTGSRIAVVLPPSSPKAPWSGYSVAALRDLDGDARGDLAILGPYCVAPGFAGRVEIFSGAPDAAMPYGIGCPGTGGFVPELSASPVSADDLQLNVVKGFGGSAGLFLLGLDSAAPLAKLYPSLCPRFVEPILFTIPFALTGSGAGNGTFQPLIHLPPAVQASFSLQALVEAPTGVVGKFAASNGLQISIH